ncbi:hypothetical protein BSAF29S_00945 [Bacillus safensis subsp. safensis]
MSETNRLAITLIISMKWKRGLPHIHFDYIFGEEESNLIGVGAGKFEMAANWFFVTLNAKNGFFTLKFRTAIR